MTPEEEIAHYMKLEDLNEKQLVAKARIMETIRELNEQFEPDCASESLNLIYEIIYDHPYLRFMQNLEPMSEFGLRMKSSDIAEKVYSMHHKDYHILFNIKS